MQGRLALILTNGAADEVEIEARGLACPLPVFELAKAARRAAPGAVLHLVGSDPGIHPDVTSWCEATGATLLELTSGPGVYGARVKLR